MKCPFRQDSRLRRRHHGGPRCVRELATEPLHLLASAQRLVRHHQILPCPQHPGRPRRGLLHQDLVSRERFPFRARVVPLSQQRPPEPLPRGTHELVIGRQHLAVPPQHVLEERDSAREVTPFVADARQVRQGDADHVVPVVVHAAVDVRHAAEAGLGVIEPPLLLRHASQLVQRRRHPRVHRAIHPLLDRQRPAQQRIGLVQSLLIDHRGRAA